MVNFVRILLSFFAISLVQANPFAISFSSQTDLSNDDYSVIQQQISAINTIDLVKELYPENQGYTGFWDFHSRISTGSRGKLIDPEKGLYPIVHLEKIGKGGTSCIVSYVNYNGNYPLYLQSLIRGLHASGFNGYLYYRIGGFPNPTHKEIQYAGVPYAFKIFLMVEANNLGFDSVLWIDSAMIPLRDPSTLFSRINKNGAVFLGTIRREAPQFILPSTAHLLKKLTGTDVLNSSIPMGGIFGLKMNTPKAKLFVEEYYKLVDLGYPFFSCFPEEFVFSAILGKPEFYQWRAQWTEEDNKLFRISYPDQDSLAQVEKSRNAGYVFHHRAMKNFIPGWDN